MWDVGGWVPPGSESRECTHSFRHCQWGHLGVNNIQRALMSDLGEPFAMWDSGASHFLMPMSSLPKSTTGTSRAV
eukprot:12898533-Prorocentrum_lima.AAC.1